MSNPAPYPQRNPHSYALDVPAIPATVRPGEVVMWPTPIAGFEPVTDSAPPPSPEPAPSKKKAAAPAAMSGEEPAQ
jgi:hypothetical protein